MAPGRRSVLSSLGVHAAVVGVLALMMHVRGPVLAPEHMPGTAQGTVLMFNYQLLGSPPGATTAKARVQAKGPALPRPAKSPADKAKQLTQAATNEAPGNAADGSEGDGNISIALVQFHPRPTPDLSALAPGASGDVVLDALIDAEGHISHLSVTKSLGANVDQQVIATVQTWTFTPATRNGTPIASEQELLFHYERRGSAG
ncbi:MAG TPA: energy transducer TonB [Acidobacteriaceae bacterium]|nr:energy transducer TonB [Acidobacteriaceae bacterium]